MPSARIRRRSGESAIPTLGRKTRITIRIDDDVLRWFRKDAGAGGGGYQSLINRALREYVAREPLEATLRRVIREELARAQGRGSPHAYGYENSRPAMVADDIGTEYGASLKRRRRRKGLRKV
jgi:hypothetical protein